MAKHNTSSAVSRSPWSCWPRGRVLFLAAFLLHCPFLTGCAALTNPVGDGVPVRHLPPEILGKPKDPEKTIPLALLGQSPPDTYRLAPGDVLGVWIEGVLGDRTVPLPVHVGPQIQTPSQRRLPPAAGYPAPVNEDGTLTLPLVGAVEVRNLSLAQAEEAIRKAYAAKQILPAGRERVLVTLLQPRQYHVVVMRQESGSIPGAEALVGSTKRGTGFSIDLPAYENDVLHALAATGGLPGLDACNEVIIFRGYYHNSPRGTASPEQDAAPAAGPDLPAAGAVDPVVRIPLRARPGEPLPFRPEDVVLQTGDVVFLEALNYDVFYTGGLLPAGEYPLPRDRDLDVVEAVSRVRGPIINGAFATSNLAGNLIAPGIGGPSPSLLTVLRRLPSGGRVLIKVDLNRAFRNPNECIRVQPGDVLILQEKPSEALARYFTQTLFNFSLAWQVIRGPFTTGVIDISAPEQIPSRIGITNFTNVPQR